MKILLDAGHGGTDSGAIGKTIIEKDYNLEIIKLIKNELNNYECNVILSRERDKHVTLSERTTLSNVNECDLFISIHCNSFKDDTVNGFESYGYKINDFQRYIHKLIIEKIKIKDRGVKEKDFFVLRNTNCKAVLLELGFISNSIDSEILNNNKYLIANTIAQAIVDFYKLKEVRKELYTVQVGAFKNKDNAIKLKNKLIDLGLQGFITVK